MIIQRQVDAEAAGVAFSLNPINNCYDEAFINANHGLGESVVAGDADPDVFIVDKVKGEIIEQRIGGKRAVIRLKAGGGTTKSFHNPQAETAISPEQALELTHLLEKVEAYYQKPVDIEWAMAAGNIFLLQARPITTYLPLPPEMITAPGEPKRLYANSTLIEQGLQEPLSVLGTDFLGYVLNKVGGPVAEGAIGPDGITFTAGGGYYMNISYSLMMGMKNAALAPGSFGDPRVMEILNGIDMRHYTQGGLPLKLISMRRKMALKMLPMIKTVVEAYFLSNRVLAKFQEELPEQNRRIETFTAEGKSLHTQAILLTDMLSFFYGDYGIPMILAGQIAQQRIRRLFKSEEEQVKDHLINLGVALPGNMTTAMGEAMYDLAGSAEFRRFATYDEFHQALEEGSVDPGLQTQWNVFLNEFGFRCPREIDPATPRLAENPSGLFEQLKTLSIDHSSAYFDAAREKREAAYQALYACAQKKGEHKARAFARYYHRWVTFGGYRETPKHYVIKIIAQFRRQALSIARQLTAANRLDHPEQIFNLTIADIDRAMTDPTVDLKALANERSRLIQKIRKSKLTARIIDSRGKVFYPPSSSSSEGDISGIPISPGVVQGRVKMLLFANEKPVLPGEILVARATDPGWTPLFINAKGIILEIGGALQHGAVVAREYGIPCVSGCDNATQLLRDGQLVEVDGSNGVVRILESN